MDVNPSLFINFTKNNSLLEAFEIEITVTIDAIDALNHVNNVTYLQWVQDVAEQHWTAKTETDTSLREKYAWVVMNHYIEYKAPAFEKDILILKTWVVSQSGVTCARHTEISRKTDQKLLVKAKTIWCLLDKTSGRPTRITETLTNLF